jgi:pilus assembly protein CpaB
MRAVAVRVNDVISVAGYVLPGTRVDVIVTMHPAQESISRIVLSNVKVLSTASNIDTGQARKGEAAQNPPLVTLELTRRMPNACPWPRIRARLHSLFGTRWTRKRSKPREPEWRASLGPPRPSR